MINHFKSFFSLTKKELNGILVISFILVIIAFAPFIHSFYNKPEIYQYDDYAKEIAAFRASAITNNRYKKHFPEADNTLAYPKTKPEYFKFNPNGLPIKQWQRLGLSNKQIQVIKNFESKGGRFYRKEDLQKIYSLKADDYARLAPFIEIPERKNYLYNKFNKTEIHYPDKKVFAIVELNSADSAGFETLKGIGPAFAARIVKYRNRLGGFINKTQLMEVYGLDSVKYAALENQVEINAASVQKINVNTATFDDLKRHPYLTYKYINAIIQYRKQHGFYHSVYDLRKILVLKEDVISKIAPYLAF